MKSTLKRFLPKSVARWLLTRRIRRSWIQRRSSSVDNHLELYWLSGDSASRTLLIDLVLEEVGGCLNLAFLDYGSHVGINLRLISDRLGAQPATFYAVEPNREAYDFMMVKMPYIVGLNGEDVQFTTSPSFPPQGVCVSISNSVFYCMTPDRTRRVLAKLAKVSQCIVIGDAMDSVEEIRSQFHADPIYYSHPYRLWLQELGFEIAKVLPAPAPQPQLNGFLVATRITR